MANSVPRSLVAGVPREQLPYGLFSVAVPREGVADRFENGVEFESLKLPDVGESVIGSYVCETDDTTTDGLPKTVTGERTLGGADEFTVYAMNKCSPIGNSLGDAQRLAREELLAKEQTEVEYRIWNAADDGLDALATSLLPATSIKQAVADIEAKFAYEYGSLGVIHAPRDVATLMLSNGLVEARGARLYTKLGTPVVAGNGYYTENALPIIISPPIFIYRSEVFEASNRVGDLLDTGTNDLYGIAERTYVPAIDQVEYIYKITLETE